MRKMFMVLVGLFIVVMIFVVPVSAGTGDLSIQVVTSPDTVAPNETFSFNILVNHDGHGNHVPWSEWYIPWDASHVTIVEMTEPLCYPPSCYTNLMLDSPIGGGGSCYCEESFPGGGRGYCDCGVGGLQWDIRDQVTNEFLFSEPITGRVEADTPPGTTLAFSACVDVYYGSTEPGDIMSVCSGSSIITVGNPISSPEFPSGYLPATLIIGFLGAVLLIRRTREH